MCYILGISRSTYYSKVNFKKSNREIENEVIIESIVRIYNNSKCVYGASRIHAALIKENINISLKKVQRFMKDLGIRSITIKKYRLTSSKKLNECLEIVLKRDFSTTTINEKRASDITYIHTLTDGWCYLASVLDLHSKKIVGYSFGKNMTNELVTTALKNTCYLQGITNKAETIFHSDLGSQYTSKDMRDLCIEFNILQFFSKKGYPYNNACIESFHAGIKKKKKFI